MIIVKLIVIVSCVSNILINAFINENNNNLKVGNDIEDVVNSSNSEIYTNERNPAEVFNGVYSECVLFFSFSCIQRKTLLYLKELNNQEEVPIFGNYVKFVKVNPTLDQHANKTSGMINVNESSTKDLPKMIDDAVEEFFGQHRLRLHPFGKDVDVGRTVDEFVGRKRRKGGGGGGSKDDGGKKKMMMMAMMCMKMKMMVMIPAMMGMMGMMSFKGMMFSMMSFMIAKMMLLMKLLEKKGGAGGGGGGGGDGSWAASGGGGPGAWMPAAGGGGGSSDGYGGPGGGYNAAGEWQSRNGRSIPVLLPQNMASHEAQVPLISYVTPVIRYQNVDPYTNSDHVQTYATMNKNNNEKNTENIDVVKNLNDERIIVENKSENAYAKDENITEIFKEKFHSRKKRGIMDLISYVSTILTNNIMKTNFKYQNLATPYPRYRIINGVKYVYYPQRYLNRLKYPKMMPIDGTKQSDDLKPIVAVEEYNKGEIVDFNKGEIVDQVAEGRMNRKKLQKMKDTMKDVVEDNPWE